MKITKQYLRHGWLSLRAPDGTRHDLAVFNTLFKEAKKAFPNLKRKDMQVVFYRLKNREVPGIEFFSDKMSHDQLAGYKWVNPFPHVR